MLLSGVGIEVYNDSREVSAAVVVVIVEVAETG